MSAMCRRSVSVFSVIALLAACAAVALAVNPHKGALYTGSESSCTASLKSEGLTCQFQFRVSKDGKTMRLVSKRDVAGAYGCHGGGGFAVFGSHKWGPHGSNTGSPVPVMKIHKDGSFSGTVHFYQGTGKFRTRITLTAKGRFTGKGGTAQIAFYTQGCVSGPVKLTAH